jgi:hypothetical protein
MKAIKLISTVLVITALIATPMAAMAGKGKAKTSTSPTPATCSVCVVTKLSTAEVDTLKFMREEEKVARDVYSALSPYYPGTNVFKNIAASEQKHFDAIGEKLVLYGIDDPASDQAGVFNNPDLQAMYDALLIEGMSGYEEALGVGVTIEEEDIVDLELAIAGTTSKPLILTYKHLLNGSESHLAAFTKLLDRL